MRTDQVIDQVSDQVYMVYIQIKGLITTKRFKLRVTANGPDDAKQQVLDSIEIVKVAKVNVAKNDHKDDTLEQLKNIFGMK